MDTSNSFDWRTLGKADYAQASALVASLPAENRGGLEGVSREILCRIVYLSWRFSETSGRGSAYCWPKLSTLGKWVGRSIRTVERHLIVLRNAGLIAYRGRLNKTGAHTSNLYQVGKTFLASLFARGKKKSPTIRPPTKMSSNDLKREYNADEATERPAFLSNLLAKSRQTRPLAPRGATVELATTWGDEKEDREARRIRDRAIAATLIARGL